MTLALADLEMSIKHLKSQYDEMPVEFEMNITKRLLKQYNIYIDLLKTLISYQTGVNKLQRMIDDQTVKDTQEQHQKVLQEFQINHNIKLQNELESIRNTYEKSGYGIYLFRGPDNVSNQKIINRINNYLINTILNEFLQSIQDKFDKKLKKFTDELNTETTAIIEQCIKSTKFQENQLIDYMTKSDIANSELIEYSSKYSSEE